MIKPILLTCAVLLCADTRLATQYEADKGFQVEFESSHTMKTTSFSMERDGEPFERPGGGGDMESTAKRQAVFTDKIVAAKDGKPSKVTRSFETLAGSSTTSFGGEETTRELEPQLTGVTLSLEREDGGEIAVKVVDGTAPSDDACLEGHRLELALDALLPEGEVADGASWELDKDAVRRALALDMEKALYPRAAPTEEEGGGGGRGGGGRFRGGMGGGDGRVLDAAEWEGKATLSEEQVEKNGVACRVVTLELTAKGDLAEPEWGGGGGRRGQALGLPLDPAAFASTYKIELEGKLFFSTAEKRPVAMEVEGTVQVESDTERQMRESTVRTRSTREGTYKQSVTITRP